MDFYINRINQDLEESKLTEAMVNCIVFTNSSARVCNLDTESKLLEIMNLY